MLLITGATGTIGRPLIDALLNQGAKVRAITHNPQAANLPAEVEVVEGDLSQPDTIAPSSLRASPPCSRTHAPSGSPRAELLGLARQQGVQRVVPCRRPTSTTLDQQYNGDRNKEVEDAAVASGLAWVSLRASSFAANTLRTWGAQIRADVVRYPYANFAEALIHERDLAEVIAHALHSDDLGPQGPTAGADRPAVAHPPAAGRHDR